MSSFKVQFFSDSMLKHLDEAFQQLHYDSYEAITCAPGSEITKIPQMTKLTKNCDLFVINTGINNLLNFYSVSNCLHLYEKVYQSLRQSHPTTEIAFTSVSYVSDNRFDETDRSAEINPLVEELNDALKNYCSEHDVISFMDLRPYLKGKNDTLIDRKNLASDGLHYSRKGTEVIAKALVYETDKVLAEMCDKHASKPVNLEAISKESWPALPKPSLQPRIRPAAYPGKQFRTIVVTNRMKTPETLSSDKQTTVKNEIKNCSNQHQKRPKRLDIKHSIKLVTCRVRKTSDKPTKQKTYVRKTSDKPTKQKTYISKRPTVNVHQFQVPTSNRYDALDVEEIPCQQTMTQMTLNFPTITKKSNTKRKPLKLNRKQKMTKLECAARGCHELNQLENTQHLKKEYYYANPYRNSPFETLMWTKAGFIQRASCDEPICTFDVQNVCDMIRSKYCCTEGITKKSEKHLSLMLLLSGDIETNPGPRMKKQSTRSKKEKLKLKRLQETEDERTIRLEKAKTSVANTRADETKERRQIRLSRVSQQMSKLRSEETPDKKIKQSFSTYVKIKIRRDPRGKD